VEPVTAPMSGDGEYEAAVANWQSAVEAAVSGNAAQQAQAAQWFDAGLLGDPQAHSPAAGNAPNL
jgi:hypothetical protein